MNLGKGIRKICRFKENKPQGCKFDKRKNFKILLMQHCSRFFFLEYQKKMKNNKVNESDLNA